MGGGQERRREVALLRTLGASIRVLRNILATEVVALAVLAAFVGASIAAVASWLLVHFIFELPVFLPWSDFALLACASVVVSTLLGALGTGRDHKASPLARLRGAV